MDEKEYEFAIKKLKAQNVLLMAKVKDAWKAGFTASLHRYTWWKDGVQYVGSCGTTLSKALYDLDKETKGGS